MKQLLGFLGSDSRRYRTSMLRRPQAGQRERLLRLTDSLKQPGPLERR